MAMQMNQPNQQQKRSKIRLLPEEKENGFSQFRQSTASQRSVQKAPKQGLKFEKVFKPHKHQSTIFLWGKARPPRLFPQHTDQIQPYEHEDLTKKRFIYLAAAKDGHHALGFTTQDWTFCWGETKFPGALGLGKSTRSTLPFLLKPLKKQHVVQIACSSRHGIALTSNSVVYSWGAKHLTNLQQDTSAPIQLNFLDNLGITGISCSSTHSAGWVNNTSNVFTWGLDGHWLGNNNINANNNQYNQNNNVINIANYKVDFGENVKNDKSQTIKKVECSTQYTLFLFNSGFVSTCGVNEHGRMGLGKNVSYVSKPQWIRFIRPKLQNDQNNQNGNLPVIIGEISAGVFHSGYITFEGELFTCGVGTDYRLGHGNEENVYEPKLIESLNKVKLVRVECVGDRTYAITQYGCVLMWGCQPVARMVHTAPFVLEYMRHNRIYQICGTKDFTVALGVEAKNPVPRPELDVVDDVRQKKTFQQLNSTIVDVINDSHQVSTKDGYSATGVYGNFVQVTKQERANPNPNPPKLSPQMNPQMSPQMNPNMSPQYGSQYGGSQMNMQQQSPQYGSQYGGSQMNMQQQQQQSPQYGSQYGGSQYGQMQQMQQNNSQTNMQNNNNNNNNNMSNRNVLNNQYQRLQPQQQQQQYNQNQNQHQRSASPSNYSQQNYNQQYGQQSPQSKPQQQQYGQPQQQQQYGQPRLSQQSSYGKNQNQQNYQNNNNYNRQPNQSMASSQQFVPISKPSIGGNQNQGGNYNQSQHNQNNNNANNNNNAQKGTYSQFQRSPNSFPPIQAANPMQMHQQPQHSQRSLQQQPQQYNQQWK